MKIEEALSYIKRELGEPVIKTKLTDEQISQQLDNAIDAIVFDKDKIETIEEICDVYAVRKLAVAYCRQLTGYILSSENSMDVYSIGLHDEESLMARLGNEDE